MTNYPYQPNYQPPPQIIPPAGSSINGFGVAALVLGIIACVIAWIPLCGVLSYFPAGIGGILAIVGIIMSANNKQYAKGMAIAGGIVCLFAICMQIAVGIWFSHKMESVSKDIQARAEQFDAEMKAAQAAAATRAASTIAVGEHVQIEAIDVAYGSADVATAAKVQQLLNQQKQDDIDKLVESGKVVEFKDGDECNVLAVTTKYIKLSPLSGDKAGKAFYVPADAVRRGF